MQLTALAQTVLIDRLLHLEQRAAHLSVMANIAANAAWRHARRRTRRSGC